MCCCRDTYGVRYLFFHFGVIFGKKNKKMEKCQKMKNMIFFGKYDEETQNFVCEMLTISPEEAEELAFVPSALASHEEPFISATIIAVKKLSGRLESGEHVVGQWYSWIMMKRWYRCMGCMAQWRQNMRSSAPSRGRSSQPSYVFSVR